MDVLQILGSDLFTPILHYTEEYSTIVIQRTSPKGSGKGSGARYYGQFQ